MHLKKINEEEEFSVINLAPQNNKVTKKTETDKYLEEKIAMEKEVQSKFSHKLQFIPTKIFY